MRKFSLVLVMVVFAVALIPGYASADMDAGADAPSPAAPAAGQVIISSPAGNVVAAPPASPTGPTNQVVAPAASPTASSQGNASGQLLNPLGANGTLPGLLTSILAFVVRIGTFVVIFMLVYVGYLFVAARGAPAKIEEAKKALLWTVVGALILLGAQAIAAGIQATVQSIGNGNTVTANPNAPPVPAASQNGQVVY